MIIISIKKNLPQRITEMTENKRNVRSLKTLIKQG